VWFESVFQECVANRDRLLNNEWLALENAMPLYHWKVEDLELTDKLAERLDLIRHLQSVASDCVSIPVWHRYLHNYSVKLVL
jgi:hypothetical protein